MSLALVNGVLSFVFLTIIGAKLPAIFALIAFLGSLIPLVGTISAAVIVFVGQLALVSTHPQTWIAVAVYYVIYMQVEAYLLSPNIMNRAVKVPGVVVVVAALGRRHAARHPRRADRDPGRGRGAADPRAGRDPAAGARR